MIRLKNGNLKAGLDPKGACLTYFRYGDLDLLRPRNKNSKDPLQASCFPCVPYFGRIKEGIPFNNKKWQLVPTHKTADPNNAIHGEGWISDWDMDEQKSDYVKLILKGDTKPGFYPFAWRVEQALSLSPDCLNLELSLKNLSGQRAPFGLALHPFFLRTSSTTIQFNFQEIHTPPGFTKINLAEYVFSDGTSLPDFTIDHSFKGWSGNVLITDELTGLRFSLSSNAQSLHVYAPKGESYFCLEPITQLPGAFSNERMLAHTMIIPNQEQKLIMNISI